MPSSSTPFIIFYIICYVSHSRRRHALRLTVPNDCSTSEDGTDTSCRKVGDQPQTYAALHLGRAKAQLHDGGNMKSGDE